jgi:hypothetical protein
MQLHDLVPVLQLATGPVIVISGVGLVLLSMTNRYGRVIDRARILADATQRAEAHEGDRFSSQLTILARRARLLRVSIFLATASLLLAAFLIITLFLTALMKIEAVGFIITLFCACMAALIASLLVFLVDINVSLSALELEVRRADGAGE